jgi:hypothetical protein
MSMQITRRHIVFGASTLATISLLSGEVALPAQAVELNPQPLPLSPEWKRAMPLGSRFSPLCPFLSRARAKRLVETTAQRLTSTGQDGSMAGGWWCGSDPALRS